MKEFKRINPSNIQSIEYTKPERVFYYHFLTEKKIFNITLRKEGYYRYNGKYVGDSKSIIKRGENTFIGDDNQVYYKHKLTIKLAKGEYEIYFDTHEQMMEFISDNGLFKICSLVVR
jgi:hypothetical protein